MKLIFFTYDFPYPTNSGGKTRAYNLLKYGMNGVDVSLFSFVRENFDYENLKQLKRIGVNEIHLFKRKNVRDLRNIPAVLSWKNSIFHSLYFGHRIEEELIDEIQKNKIDAVLYESYYTAFYLSGKVKELQVKQIFGTENIEHALYKEYISSAVSSVLKPFYLYQYQKIKKEEISLLKKADLCLAVTNTEAEVITQLTRKKTYVIENGVDLGTYEFKSKKATEKKNILFIGNFSYFPNIEAMRFFYYEVFQYIKNPHITLTIIGRFADRLQLPPDEAIRYIDYVADIQDAYHDADIFVSPIRIGGGTNFKILESFACGVPVVAFPDRLEGLEVKNGIHVLSASTGNEFQHKIEILFHDSELRENLIQNARTHVEKKFDWHVIGSKLNSILLSL